MSRLPLFFSPGEWYHCYSRGIDKRIVYENHRDYERFTELLYLANSEEALQRSDLNFYDHKEIFSIPRKGVLVDIGAYCLMSNHFHLLLHETEEGGISKFMQKLGTAYTMYFNIKNERSGGLFTKPFRARHVPENRYFQYVVDYIHANAIERVESKWGTATTADKKRLTEKVLSYPYSSFADFFDSTRPQRAILGTEIFDAYDPKDPQAVIDHALEYRQLVKATP